MFTSEVARARCPGCQRVLRIPAGWVRETLRCKHCRMMVQVRPRSVAALQEDASAFNGVRAGAAPLIHNGSVFAGLATRRRHRGAGWTGVLIALVLLGGAGIALYMNWDWVSSQADRVIAEVKQPDAASKDTSDNTNTGNGSPASPADGGATAPTPPARESEPPPFPRRILAVSVNNYLYANPVSYGSLDDDALETGPDDRGKRPDRNFHVIMNHLAEVLHVAPSQLVELSDALPRHLARPPLKPVIENTVTEFLDTCRAQDRIVVVFVGHAVELDGENYLVPIEGELGVKDTLIPLKWLFDRLAQCQAQQKVLIMDVCRFNPSRGLERPAGGAMGAKLDAALANPPPAVQVWSACVAGQFSYEGAVDLPNNEVGLNSYFMNDLFEVVAPYRRKVNTGVQKPEDPLPIEVLANGAGAGKGVNAWTEFDAADVYQVKQTPRLSGRPAATAVAYDPNERLPDKQVIKLPQPADGEAAGAALVQPILNEIDAQMLREGAHPIRYESLPVFSAKRLAEYKEDSAMTPFREEVLKTTKLLRRHTETFKDGFRGNGGDAAIKRIILESQQKPARAFAELMNQLEALKEAGEDRTNEKSPRWRANYDFVLAKLEARLAYIYEYNYMLGQIRKDALPPRDPAKHSGWRLAATEKLQSGSEARKLAADSRKLLAKLAKEHKDTPWEVLAKRETLTALGLEWKPTR